MKVAALELLALWGCQGGAAPPEAKELWSISAPLAGTYPIRAGTCSNDATWLAVDVGPTVFQIDQHAIRNASDDAAVEGSIEGVVLRGAGDADVVDAQTNAKYHLPAAPRGTPLWAVSSGGGAIARAVSGAYGNGTRLDFASASASWSLDFPGSGIANLRVAPDGRHVAAIVVGEKGAAALHLLNADKSPACPPIALGKDSPELLAFDDSGARIATTTYADEKGDSLVVYDMACVARIQAALGREAAAVHSSSGHGVSASLHGDQLWTFAAGTSTQGDHASYCRYARFQLKDDNAKVMVTDDRLAKWFGPEGGCRVRAICASPTGEVRLVEHDHDILTVRALSGAP